MKNKKIIKQKQLMIKDCDEEKIVKKKQQQPMAMIKK